MLIHLNPSEFIVKSTTNEHVEIVAVKYYKLTHSIKSTQNVFLWLSTFGVSNTVPNYRTAWNKRSVPTSEEIINICGTARAT